MIGALIATVRSVRRESTAGKSSTLTAPKPTTKYNVGDTYMEVQNTLAHLFANKQGDVIAFMAETRSAAQHLNVDLSTMSCVLETPLNMAGIVRDLQLLGIVCHIVSTNIECISCRIQWQKEGENYMIEKSWKV